MLLLLLFRNVHCLRVQLLGFITVPFQLETAVGVLTFFSTTMVFGTPVDITLSELAIESFFPADAETGAKLRMMAEG